MKAEALSRKTGHVGAVAFSRTGDPATSDFGEPGLSLDVIPIATQLARLAMLELLADKSSTLNVLKRDFDAPWYLWLNRPEPGTQYADMPPLSESRDELTINRWYGIYFERDEQCPVCGDFLSGLAAAYGLDATQLPALPEKE